MQEAVMSESKVYPVAIVGGGSAGTMAALRSVLNNDECLFFPGTIQNRKGSREFWVKKIENIPGHFEFKKGVEGPNKQTWDWLANECELKHNFHWMQKKGVVAVHKIDEGHFELEDSDGEKYRCRFLVLCTGGMDIQPIIQGEMKSIFPYANAQSIDYCIRCDGHHVFNRHAAVIGHGSGAAWVACLLHERYKCPSMTLLTHGKPPEHDDKLKALIERYEIKVYESEIMDVNGVRKGGKLEGFTLADGTNIDCTIAFVSLGMIVYNELAVSLGATIDERGFVVTSDKGKTNVAGLYVAGDLRANIKKQVYSAWDTSVDTLDAINAEIRADMRAY